MDKQRAELIERFYEAFLRRDVDAIVALCDESIEIYKDPDVVEMVSALTPRGHERVATYLRGWLDSWDMYRPSLAGLREAAGDEVVALVEVRARGRGSQFDIDEEIADVFTFRGERIVRLRLHVTREVALRDAGLEP
ncbi:MAG: nuclear transport factor 2 family protein [Solirubrobacterales bacterium]